MRQPEDELADLKAQSLYRELRTLDSAQGPEVEIDGRRYLNSSSNDYLGLANDPELKAAFIAGVEKYGTGSGASRLVCGTQRPHADLEEGLAALKGTEAALTFSSGYVTAVGTLTALCGKDDILILDKLCHASLIDGARLSGATIRVFPHLDLNKLESHLRWAREKFSSESRVIVVTESVFSMDGDRAPLADMVALKEQYGAWLLVDEAHAFGVIGPGGRGLINELGLSEQVELQMGTLSKAAGLSGGYLCASRAVIELLINRARGFIYSTAPPPSVAAAGVTALEIVAGERGNALREKLWGNLSLLGTELGAQDVLPESNQAESAILPIILGESDAALAAAASLKEQGFVIPAIRYPTVPRGQARLRVTLTAAHSEDQVRQLAGALGSVVVKNSSMS